MQQLPTFAELAQAKLDIARPREKIITIKIAINTARMMVAAESHKATDAAFRGMLQESQEEPTVRQTACRHCDLDIENFAPFKRGEWSDRGGNRRCNDGKHQHAPVPEEL